MTRELFDTLGIQQPIVLSGMAGGSTTPELVAAVSNAGGMGTFGATGMSVEGLRTAVRSARSQTRGPIAVNVLLAPPTTGAEVHDELESVLAAMCEELGMGPPTRRAPPGDALDLVSAALEEGADVVSAGLGDPAPLRALADAAGAPLLAMAAVVEDAAQAVASGADVIVAQGAEAGGHRSNFVVDDDDVPLVGTLALVPRMVDALDVPVIAAGGISDGRGVAAALCLGAVAAQIGTRFLATEEAGVPPSYQRSLREAREVDAVVTSAISGRPARGIRNRLMTALGSGGHRERRLSRSGGSQRSVARRGGPTGSG